MPSRSLDASVKRQALSAADMRVMPDEPLRWSDALAEAPWPVSLLAWPAYEKQFRRIYAARLVKRGAAVPAVPNRGGKSGPSGESKLTRRTFRQTDQEFEEQDAKAASANQSWNDWARRKLGQ